MKSLNLGQTTLILTLTLSVFHATVQHHLTTNLSDGNAARSD